MGQGVIADLPRLVEPFCKGGKVGVITDDTVDALYAAKAVWAMEQYGYDVCKYVIPYGESSKNINTLSGIWSILLPVILRERTFSSPLVVV